MEVSLYFYNASVTSVYDGDTCTVDVDLGFATWVKGEKIRLARIDAPEMRGAEREKGISARDFLRRKIDGREVVIKTIKDQKEKYGRYLAEIYITDDNGNLINVNDLMVTEGLAEYRQY